MTLIETAMNLQAAVHSLKQAQKEHPQAYPEMTREIEKLRVELSLGVEREMAEYSSLTAMADATKERAESMVKLSMERRGRAETIKRGIVSAMKIARVQRVEETTCDVSLLKPKKRVHVDDPAEIPMEYLRKAVVVTEGAAHMQGFISAFNEMEDCGLTVELTLHPDLVRLYRDLDGGKEIEGAELKEGGEWSLRTK